MLASKLAEVETFYMEGLHLTLIKVNSGAGMFWKFINFVASGRIVWLFCEKSHQKPIRSRGVYFPSSLKNFPAKRVVDDKKRKKVLHEESGHRDCEARPILVGRCWLVLASIKI
jgi:hypothetical protein